MADKAVPVIGEARRLSEGQEGPWEPVAIYLLQGGDVELSRGPAVAAVLFEGHARKKVDIINHQERGEANGKRD